MAREAGVEEDVITRIFDKLALVEHAAVEELARRGFDASEANPAIVKGSRVYTGDWVGVASLKVNGVQCDIVLRPKIPSFDDIVSRALEALHALRLTQLYAAILSSIAAAGAIRLPGAILAAEYISEYARSRPPTRETLATVAYMLYAALAAASQRLKALRVPRVVAAQALQPLLTLTTDPLIARALLEAEETEPDTDEPLEAALLAKTSLLYTSGAFLGPTLLLPSPKLFELAALAETLRALRASGACRKPRWDQANKRITCNDAIRIYLNTAPRSTIVEKLAGTRLHPDIVIEYGTILVVIEAKYRRPGSSLNLGDATRIAAYLYDLQPDALIIVYPLHPEKPRHVAENIIETNLDTLPSTLHTITSYVKH